MVLKYTLVITKGFTITDVRKMQENLYYIFADKFERCHEKSFRCSLLQRDMERFECSYSSFQIYN